MTENEREQIVKFLKSNGWDENRCVDTSDFRYELMDDPDNEFLGEKYVDWRTNHRASLYCRNVTDAAGTAHACIPTGS